MIPKTTRRLAFAVALFCSAALIAGAPGRAEADIFGSIIQKAAKNKNPDKNGDKRVDEKQHSKNAKKGDPGSGPADGKNKKSGKGKGLE